MSTYVMAEEITAMILNGNLADARSAIQASANPAATALEVVLDLRDATATMYDAVARVMRIVED